jgi:membrane protease YdiL (CAAX protease family)
VLVGAVAYLVGIGGTVALFTAVPDMDPVGAGLLQYAISGGLGIVAFVAAYLIRIRRLDVLGVRRVAPRWVLVGAGGGVVTFALGLAVGVVMGMLLGAPENIQGDYQAAAAGGALAFAATVALGSLLTPLGEELFFRGVLANSLGRITAWVAVPASALIFAVAHGINAVLPTAFIVGIVTALLFRRTGSIWPGVATHAVHNLLATLFPLVLGALLPA